MAPAACATSPRCVTSRPPPRCLRFLGRDVKVAAPRGRRRRRLRRAPRGAVRAGEADARERAGAGAARRAVRARQGVAPGRLPDRRTPHRPAPEGPGSLGCTIRLERGYVIAEGPAAAAGFAATRSCFDIPTVTGTENLMMAAALAKGRTTLVNCAREPEVEELGRVLNKMGAEVDGAGTDVIHIVGSERGELAPFDHAIISDRIEAGTYMVAAAIAEGGDVILEGAELRDLEALVAKMRAAGVEIASEGQSVRVRRRRPAASAVNMTTAPHPGFPTDMQAQFLVLMCFARGESVISETIFENRFMHVPELQRMGASVALRGNTAVVQGVEKLYGASVMATDLRASASLVIAGLVAEDETEVRRVYHIDRGYERIEDKLARSGGENRPRARRGVVSGRLPSARRFCSGLRYRRGIESDQRSQVPERRSAYALDLE